MTRQIVYALIVAAVLLFVLFASTTQHWFVVDDPQPTSHASRVEEQKPSLIHTIPKVRLTFDGKIWPFAADGRNFIYTASVATACPTCCGGSVLVKKINSDTGRVVAQWTVDLPVEQKYHEPCNAMDLRLAVTYSGTSLFVLSGQTFMPSPHGSQMDDFIRFSILCKVTLETGATSTLLVRRGLNAIIDMTLAGDHLYVLVSTFRPRMVHQYPYFQSSVVRLDVDSGDLIHKLPSMLLQPGVPRMQASGDANPTGIRGGADGLLYITYEVLTGDSRQSDAFGPCLAVNVTDLRAHVLPFVPIHRDWVVDNNSEMFVADTEECTITFIDGDGVEYVAIGYNWPEDGPGPNYPMCSAVHADGELEFGTLLAGPSNVEWGRHDTLFFLDTIAGEDGGVVRKVTWVESDYELEYE